MILGTVHLERLFTRKELEERDKIVFNPLPNCRGIETTDDPLWEFRATLYSITGRQRKGELQYVGRQQRNRKRRREDDGDEEVQALRIDSREADEAGPSEGRTTLKRKRGLSDEELEPEGSAQERAGRTLRPRKRVRSQALQCAWSAINASSSQ